MLRFMYKRLIRDEALSIQAVEEELEQNYGCQSTIEYSEYEES